MSAPTPEYIFAAALLAYLAGAALPILRFGHPGRWATRTSLVAALVGSVLALGSAYPALLGYPVRLTLPGLLPYLGNHQVALDPTSAFFVLLVGGLAVPVTLYALGAADTHTPGSAWQAACLNVFILAMVVVVTAASVFSFLIAWEVMALASYLLVMVSHQQQEVRQAGYVYLVMTHLGTLFLFAAFLLLGRAGGGLDFEHLRIGAVTLTPPGRSLIFLFVLVGFGTKGGLIPLHIWLPRAHPVAPSHVSALMSGVMVKTAVYGLVRFGFDLLGAGPEWWGAVLLAAGATSAVAGALYASTEGHLKRLLAFSTVENIGIIAMGLGAALWLRAAGQPALAALALVAALYHTLSHAAAKGLLFLGAGAVHHATGTLSLEQMGGLIRRMPRTAFWFLAGAMAISALPPLGGLIGEWLLLQSFLRMAAAFPASVIGASGLVAAAALALTGALVAAAMVKAYGVAFLGLPRSVGAEGAHDPPWPMRAGMALLAVACTLLGLGVGLVAPLLGRVAAGLTGSATAAASAWNGSSLLAVPFPVPTSSSSPATLSPVALLAALVALAGLGWLLARRYGRWSWRVGPTWTCGILGNPRMQYGAAGYTSPIRLMFRHLLWPSKAVRVTSGEPALFPHAMEYTGGIHPIYETYLYRPAVLLILRLSHRLRRLQMGDTQVYLIYLFCTLLLLVALAR